MNSFAIAAGLIHLIAHIPLFISMIRGRVRPSTTSTGIWTFLSFSLLASSYASGVRSNLPFIAAGCLATTATFVLSFKYGYRNWSMLDPICITLGMLGIVLWIAYRDASYSVYISTAVDWIALAPVVRKSWIDPWSENLFNWRLNLIAAILLVMSISDMRAVVLVVAITQLLHSLIINALLVASPYKKKSSIRPKLRQVRLSSKYVH